MEFKKTYLTLTDAAKALDSLSEEDVLHLGANGGIPIYAVPDRWHAHLYGVEHLEQIDDYGVASTAESKPIKMSPIPFTLTVPVQLFRSTLQRLETQTSVYEDRFIAPVPENADGFIRCEYQVQNAVGSSSGVQVNRSALIVLNPDIQYYVASYTQEPVASEVQEPIASNLKEPIASELQEHVASEDIEVEKPVRTRERNTLLLIIAALAKDNGVDLTKPSAAALPIQSLVEQMGETIGLRTIEDHIKRIPLELRDQTKSKP